MLVSAYEDKLYFDKYADGKLTPWKEISTGTGGWMVWFAVDAEEEKVRVFTVDNPDVLTFDIETGKKIGQITLQTKEGEKVAPFQPQGSVWGESRGWEVSPNGRFIAFINDYHVLIFDARDGALLAKEKCSENVSSSSRLTFSRDGRYLTCCLHGKVDVWRVNQMGEPLSKMGSFSISDSRNSNFDISSDGVIGYAEHRGVIRFRDVKKLAK